MSARCMDYTALLSAFLDRELPDAELQRVQAHLDGCPACTLELKRLRTTAALLHQAGALEAPIDLARSVTRVLAERKGRRIGAFTLPPILTMRYVMPTMATLMAAGIALYWNAYMRDREYPAPATETMGVHVVPAPSPATAPAADAAGSQKAEAPQEASAPALGFARQMPAAPDAHTGDPAEGKKKHMAPSPALGEGNAAAPPVDEELRDRAAPRPAPAPRSEDDTDARRQDTHLASLATGEKRKAEEQAHAEAAPAPPPAAPALQPAGASAQLTWRVALVLPEEPILKIRPAEKDRARTAEGDAAVASDVAGTEAKGGGAPAPAAEPGKLGREVAADVAPPGAAPEPKRDVQGADLEFPRLLTQPERPERLGRVMVRVNQTGHVIAARTVDGVDLDLAAWPVFATMKFSPALRGGAPETVWVLLDPVARFGE